MLDFIKQNKIVTLGVVVAIGVLLYYLFNASSGPSLQETTPTSASPVSQDLLVTLNNLHTIKLDNTVFTDPVFTSLTDFGVVIPLETVGRRNPFAPLGANNPQSASTTTTTTRIPH